MSRVLNVILSHQRKTDLEQVLTWWQSYATRKNILVAYGGMKADYDELQDIPRVFVSDPLLRIKAQQRGKQSHGGVFRAVAEWLATDEGKSFTHIYYAEFDHLPIISDFAERLLERAGEERADVLAHGLHRVDGTSNIHYLYHLSDPQFSEFWRRISVRAYKETILKFLVTGSFLTREAFMAVAAQEEQIKAYVEIYLPTLAHHLGFRVRGFQEQDQCVSTIPVPGLSVQQARTRGCWTMHPLKTVPGKS